MPKVAGELVVELRQLPLFDAQHVDREYRRLAGEVGRRIILREQDRRGRALAGLRAAQRTVEILQDLPRAEHDRNVLALPALERLAVDGAGKIDAYAIALRRLAFDGLPGRALAAELLDHGIEVAVLDRDARYLDRELAKRLERDLGVDLEGRPIGEMPAGVGAGQRLDARTARRVELLFRDRTGIGRTDHVRHDLVPHLAAVVLPNDLLRHLARPEPFQLGRFAHLREPRGDGAFDLGGWHAHRHPALESRRALDRHLIAL